MGCFFHDEEAPPAALFLVEHINISTLDATSPDNLNTLLIDGPLHDTILWTAFAQWVMEIVMEKVHSSVGSDTFKLCSS